MKIEVGHRTYVDMPNAKITGPGTVKAVKLHDTGLRTYRWVTVELDSGRTVVVPPGGLRMVWTKAPLS